MSQTQRVISDLLHAVTTDHEVTEVRVGAFFTAVVSRGCGLASTMRSGCGDHEGPAVRRAGSLLPASGLALAELARSPREMEAALGVAAINSLLAVDQSRVTELNAADLLARRAVGRRVALVGDFPFAGELGRLARELVTLDRRDPGPPGELERRLLRLPEADICAISATTLINHTLEDILGRLRPDCFKVLLGPTTPLSPILFDHGLDALSGVVVTDVGRVLECVGQGAGFRQIEGRQVVTMARSAA